MALVPAAVLAQPLQYSIDLTHPQSHLVGVTLTIPNATREMEIQFPAWNALYQIRDFVRHVQNLQAECDGKPLALMPVDLNTWSSGAEQCTALTVRYQVYANEPGVFSSQLRARHAFLNLAEILFYLPARRETPDEVRFELPPGWKWITTMPGALSPAGYIAPGYDALVDSPVEAGDFDLYSYSQGGAAYRVVVRSDNDYPSARLLDAIKKITAAETSIMAGRPFSEYTFIFHFPSIGGGGGMEHSYGTAISFPAGQLDDSFADLENTIAHEFFHLWNVKRIRPSGLEPVNYVRGNNTSDLWFCEGVTSTYAELALLRAGLITSREFYSHLADAIGQLEERPARHFQSVAVSGLDAWLEKYADYRRPERSISYYNKGELLGYILDLAIRQASENHNSLDSLMRALEVQFAQRRRYYTDADLERLIASLGPGPAWARSFFDNDVTGTTDLDFARYLGYAGLRLAADTTLQPDWGIETIRNPGGLIEVTSVTPESGAAQAGIQSGDVLLEINGQPLYASPDQVLGLKPGERVKLRVRRGTRVLNVRLTLGARREVRYRVEEVPNATAHERAIRAGWLYGTTE